MKKEEFNIKLQIIFSLSLIVTAIISVSVYLLSQNIYISIITLSGMLFLCLISYLIHRLDDKYISEIVADLSRLTDVLTQLEEKEIFPLNEDTIVSKLQNKITKLARILKKKNESSLQEQENIKSLVSDISHQLKTPIANLIMYSEFLEDDTISKEQYKEYIKIIKISVERLNFLSESMIKVSRLESNLIHLNMKNQSLNETVLKAVKDVYVKAKNKDIEIIYNEEAKIPISHDRNWTSEALFNLLDNAIKYSKTGTKIILSIKKFGMFVSVEVIDENNPISYEERNKIFSRFYRGNNSSNIEGIGIGLYLSRQIILKQGGYMNLKSSAKGNTFSMVLHNH